MRYPLGGVGVDLAGGADRHVIRVPHQQLDFGIDEARQHSGRDLHQTAGFAEFDVAADQVALPLDKLELSSRRAAAVVKELIVGHRADPVPLEAGGAGPLAPVASNESSERRDLNRRVEIVRK